MRKKYLSNIWLKVTAFLLLSIVVVVLYAIFPEPKLTFASHQCGGAGCCDNTFGGTCMFPISGNTYNCPGGIVDNYCPSPSNYKCCVPTTTRCYQERGGKCQTVGGTQSCNQGYVSGYCPGPVNVRCCLPDPLPPPTATPPPALPTPTPTPRIGQQTNTPGVIYTGDGTPDFGNGRASTTDWVIGGSPYPEVFSTGNYISPTSYDYMFDKITQSGTTITDLKTIPSCANLANCTLPGNLAEGVYQANGNVNLNTYTFPANQDYAFLINGDLTIQASLFVPNGATAFFTAKNDIIVTQTVAAATNSFPLPAGQIQGFFSADRHFTIQGINDCVTGADRMLNMEGAIVVNAGGIGGSFRNQRDLCGDNLTIPSFTIRPRLDFIINASPFLTRKNTTFREDAP